MPKKKKEATGYETKAVCHDHFDGSAHCVQCGGECRLTGNDMAYTALVRALCESEVYGTDVAIPYLAVNQLDRSLVPLEGFRRRARKCK